MKCHPCSKTEVLSAVIAVHGGAGTISRQALSPAREAEYRNGLNAALRAGQHVLMGGGSSVEAVVAAVSALEDCPLFNAGRGSVFNSRGSIEMDAAVMDGSSRRAGAVAAVTRIRNPVRAAWQVALETSHVLLVGRGAEEFAEQAGLEMVDADYFYTQLRFDQLQVARASDKVHLDHDADSARAAPYSVDEKYGTVGAVACDRDGNLAAATSTGGLTNKKYGRVGDTPVIGAGTYAHNATAAVSATGIGEAFIRTVAAYDVAALMAYKTLDVETAAAEVIHTRIREIGGEGGLIAVDCRGRVTMPFNTEGMYRGMVRGAGIPEISIYREV